MNNNIMTTRCKHEKAIITEYGTSQTYHMRMSNGEWDHNSEFGEYTGVINVECSDCGLDKTYARNKYPKWLQLFLADIFEAQTQVL